MPFTCRPEDKIMSQKAISLLQRSTHLLHFLQIHAFLLKASLLSSPFIVSNLFLRLSLSFTAPSHLLYARAIFDRIPSPNTFVWNAMIRAYMHAHHPLESVSLFCRMCHQISAVSADSFTFSLVLQACGRVGDAGLGSKIHTRVLRLGFGAADLFVQTALVEMYGKSRDMKSALQVFNEMPKRDLFSCNVLLAEYLRSGDVECARKLFDGMLERDLVSWNTMIHGHATSSDMDPDWICNRNAVSWRSTIGAHARRRHSNEALRLFHEMQLAKVAPDRVTMVCVLSACGDMGALGMGKMVHEYIERNGIEVDVKLGTSLVDMYAKCGDIDNALEVFNKMNVKDVFTWTAMIIGLATHGFGELALDLFSKMLSEGIQPNDITLVGVLSACSHVGLVSKGWTYFTSMNDVYGVSPTIEHYGCMVDLLGRAGRLKEARELVLSMPFAPDAVIWRTFLGACRIHTNVELAEEAIVNLLELEPRVDGHYVLLSNIYAQSKQWDKVANVRKMMRSKSIEKVPGRSSTEVDNVVHEFIAPPVR